MSVFSRSAAQRILCLRAVAAVASVLAVEHEGSHKSSDVQALPRKAAVIIGVRRLRCVGFRPCSHIVLILNPALFTF